MLDEDEGLESCTSAVDDVHWLAAIWKTSMVSWGTYGLGSESEDLPAYIVSNCGKKSQMLEAAIGIPAANQQSIPVSNYVAAEIQVLYLSNPSGIDRVTQRQTLDAISSLNRGRLEVFKDPEIATRISSYEKRVRMQASAPEAIAISDEPEHIVF